MNDVKEKFPDLLGLPDRARQSHRLTKKDIAAQWESSSPADARLLNRMIASATIVGVLSPATIGAPAFHDPDHRVDIIPIIAVVLSEGTTRADATRTTVLLHRSMPRPSVIGLYETDGAVALLSFALTRLSRTEEGRSVIEDHLLVPAEDIAPDALHVMSLERTDLAALYRDLVRTAAADGAPASAALTATDAVRIRQQIGVLEADLAATVRDVMREKAMQRRIDLNTHARTLRAQIDKLRGSLLTVSNTGLNIPDQTRVDQ